MISRGKLVGVFEKGRDALRRAGEGGGGVETIVTQLVEQIEPTVIELGFAVA